MCVIRVMSVLCYDELLGVIVGLARFLTTNKTMTHGVGTLHFMPPEVLDGSPAEYVLTRPHRTPTTPDRHYNVTIILPHAGVPRHYLHRPLMCIPSVFW